MTWDESDVSVGELLDTTQLVIDFEDRILGSRVRSKGCNIVQSGLCSEVVEHQSGPRNGAIERKSGPYSRYTVWYMDIGVGRIPSIFVKRM